MPREACTALALVPPTPPAPQPAAAAAAAVPGGGAPSTTALAPGFRFHPTDEELVSYYLKRKVGNKPVRFNAIAEVDIYKNEPWELADKSRLKSRDQEWYFFSALDKKYGNGARMNRATGRGYWKATGKDREIRRDHQLIAMKKTLVFHSGRAPGGQRTNWVMHEYRLVEEELERIGILQGDSYVLCRVFHKNNIGPPSGNRYAPFMEEEWDDGKPALVPGEEAADEVVACNGAYAEMNHVEQDKYNLSKESFDFNEVPKRTRDLLSLCKNESVEMDEETPMCVLNTEAPFPLIQYKRRKHNDYDSNGSEKSTRTTQDHSSSSTTTATTTATTDTMMTTTAATTTAISALLEFSLMEPKERTPPPSPPKESTFTASSLESLVPSGCMKFINDLQREVHKVSVERETLKLDLMSTQAMINILQSRIDVLNKENDDMKRSLREGK
ncbi:unnamed protein product [Linum trigynum]|uniref:NAC domain-containing protein n=1 Tax=Linum trigynum TaxID=586398 RepID=A0AAV2EMQ7_9ROSI